MTFIFWELVGLGSYFLIGFWFYKPVVAKDHHYQELKAPYATGIDERYLSPSHAQKKGFVMNRIGDFGFLIGIGIFITTVLGAANLPEFKALNLQSGPLNFDKLYLAREKGVFDHMIAVRIDGKFVADNRRHVHIHGRDGQVGAVPVTHVAAGRDAGSDDRLFNHPCRDDGGRRRVHDGSNFTAAD